MKHSTQLKHVIARACASICGAMVIGWASLALAADETTSPLPAGAKISEEKAKEIALKLMPGKVTGVTIEKKKGKQVYVIEIMSATKGEKDVFVDTVSGKVIGVD